jgi:hypothetical protein
MRDAERGDFSFLYIDRRGVFPLVVDVMVPVLFELIADQLLSIVMVLRFNGYRQCGMAHEQ